MRNTLFVQIPVAQRLENELRRESGQDVLQESDEELSFGPNTATAPNRLVSIAAGSLVNSFSSNITQFSKSGFSKLFMLDGLQRSSAAAAAAVSQE